DDGAPGCGGVVVYGRVAPQPAASIAPLAAGLDGTGVKTASPRAWSWAALMHRAFSIDMLACAHRGGRLRLLATLHDPPEDSRAPRPLPLGAKSRPPHPSLAPPRPDRIGAGVGGAARGLLRRRPASESERLRDGDGPGGGGARRRRVLELPSMKRLAVSTHD